MARRRRAGLLVAARRHLHLRRRRHYGRPAPCTRPSSRDPPEGRGARLWRGRWRVHVRVALTAAPGRSASTDHRA
jgi:hypothetical protein